MTGDVLDHMFAPEVVRAIDARIAEQVAAAVAERDREDASPWMTPTRAAEYLGGLPVKMLYNRSSEIPHHRVGSPPDVGKPDRRRILFHKRDLDAWVDRHRAPAA